MSQSNEAMSIESFKRNLSDVISRMNPDATVVYNDIKKNNNTSYIGMCLKKKTTNEIDLSITHNISMYYEEFENRFNCSFISVAKEIMRVEAVNKNKSVIEEKIKDIFNFENIKDKIYYCLVNKERNSSRLEELVYRDVEGTDQILIYKIALMVVENQDVGSITITKQFIKEISKRMEMDIDEECIYKLASENTPRIFKADIRSMYDTLERMIGLDEEDRELLNNLNDEDEMIYIASNTCKINGNAVIMYNEHEVLKSLCQELDVKELYIVLSSIHEALLFSPYVMETMADHFEEIIKEVNNTSLAEDEIASDKLYHYSLDNNSLTIYHK